VNVIHLHGWMVSLGRVSLVNHEKIYMLNFLKLNFFWKNKLFVLSIVKPDCRVQYYVRIHYEIFSYNYVPLKYSKVFFFFSVIWFFSIYHPQSTIFLFDITQVSLASSMIWMKRNQILRLSIKDPKLGTKLVMKSKSWDENSTHKEKGDQIAFLT